MKYITRCFAHCLSLSLFAVVFLTVQIGITSAQGALTNPLSTNSLPELLLLVLNAVIIIAFPILILFLVYSGFLFVKAQGNESALSEARKTFAWTLIGGVVVLAAKAISEVIKNTVCSIVTGAARASICS